MLLPSVGASDPLRFRRQMWMHSTIISLAAAVAFPALDAAGAACEGPPLARRSRLPFFSSLG